ncbi:uncharacterized protein [Haliotis cracherodii]|uniref:uncharacterized protein n=1 Tax=Haliotis cracherodii TaxID=6455 RepID=UPI0039ED8B4C
MRSCKWGIMKDCQRDYYYNADTRDCQSCAYLCHQAEVQGTLQKCGDLCPVPVTNQFAHQTTENMKTTATMRIPDGVTVHDGSPHVVVVVCLMSVFLAFLVVLMVAVAIVRGRRKRKQHRQRTTVNYRHRDTTEDDTEEAFREEPTSNISMLS